MCKMMTSPGAFFIILKVLIFQVVRSVKGQKMAQNDKKFCLSLRISEPVPHMILAFFVDMCKMMISPANFSFFQNSEKEEKKGKK